MSKNVFYFNPTCELAVANGSFSYMPPRLLRNFEEDCSILPFLFASAKDYLISSHKPSGEFVQKLTDAGFQLPALVNLKEMVAENTISKLIPWGWSPATHFILKDLKEKCAVQFRQSPVFNWKEEHKLLFERKTSLGFLKSFLLNHPLDFLINPERTGIIARSSGDIESLLNRHPALVLKAPLSSSGRGIQIIRKASLNTSNKQWISGVLHQQQYIVAEPFLDKIMDFSFQFNMNDSGEVEYLGISVFETNTNGQYKNSLIHPEINDLLPVNFYGDVNGMIKSTAERLTHALKNSIYTHWHRGFLGIDAMIYTDEKGIRIQPCVEINSRMNMGILTMQIEKHVHPEAFGRFELFYGKPGEFYQFASSMENEKPLIIKEGKLCSGFLALTEPGRSKQFGACVQIESSPSAF